MTYDQFTELKIDDPVEVELFFWRNMHVVKEKHILPVHSKDGLGIAVETSEGLRIYHFSQVNFP